MTAPHIDEGAERRAAQIRQKETFINELLVSITQGTQETMRSLREKYAGADHDLHLADLDEIQAELKGCDEEVWR